MCSRGGIGVGEKYVGFFKLLWMGRTRTRRGVSDKRLICCWSSGGRWGKRGKVWGEVGVGLDIVFGRLA